MLNFLKTELQAWLACIVALLLVFLLPVSMHAQQGQDQKSYVAGERIASLYAYGYGNVSGASIFIGATGTGTQTYTLCPATRALPDGRVIPLFSVTSSIGFDIGTSVAETVTPTAVSLVGNPTGGAGPQQCAAVTGSFTNAHGASQNPTQIRSGTFGLMEAVNDAQSVGGWVTVDNTWLGSTSTITGAVPYSNVVIVDKRGPSAQYFTAVPTAATFLAAPATLTAVTALPSATPVGAYGTGTYHLAIAYVDAAGQVGPESADFSEAGLATGSFIFSAPAASAGAVGYVIYISLTGGTYSLDYEVPLTSSICTLTKLETVTPACAVTNATYGQTGATATVTAITVNTSPVGMILGGVSGTLLTGNPNGRTTYSWVAASRVGSVGIPTSSLPFTVGGIGSATPIAIGTVNLPAGVLNQVGKRIRVCGRFQNTDVNSTIQNIDIYLDAAGSDVAGSPVKIGALQSTGTGAGTAAAYTGQFCEEYTTTVSGAGATAGSTQAGYSLLNYYLTATPAALFVGGDKTTAAIGSLNLAGGGGFENRLSIVHTNTTGNATPQLMSLTIEVL